MGFWGFGGFFFDYCSVMWCKYPSGIQLDIIIFNSWHWASHTILYNYYIDNQQT